VGLFRCCSHHAEGLVDPNRLQKNPSLTWYAPKHVDSGKRKIKIKIAHGRSVYQLFKKRDFYFINVAKLAKIDQKWNFSIFFENSHF
jgi:hypothetical protein